MQIAIGSAPIGSTQEITSGESLGVYSNHAIKHQVGGIDEINITGLNGQAADNQKSDWSLIINKPASAVADIDDAVTKKHTQNTDTDLDATFEATLEHTANKGVASGYASLDASVLVPLAQIPATLTGKDADTVDTKHASAFVDHALVTAVNDFLIASGNSVVVKKTLEIGRAHV